MWTADPVFHGQHFDFVVPGSYLYTLYFHVLRNVNLMFVPIISMEFIYFICHVICMHKFCNIVNQYHSIFFFLLLLFERYLHVWSIKTITFLHGIFFQDYFNVNSFYLLWLLFKWKVVWEHESPSNSLNWFLIQTNILCNGHLLYKLQTIWDIWIKGSDVWSPFGLS